MNRSLGPPTLSPRTTTPSPTGPSYRLGPGLIALGEAARQGYPELPYAQDKMRELGTQLGLECMASAVVGSEIVILAKNGVPAPLSATAAMSSFLVIGPILSLYRINGSLAVMSADVGRKPCKRNDSFFENAGKLCESPTSMWTNADGVCVFAPLTFAAATSQEAQRRGEESSRNRVRQPIG